MCGAQPDRRSRQADLRTTVGEKVLRSAEGTWPTRVLTTAVRRNENQKPITGTAQKQTEVRAKNPGTQDRISRTAKKTQRECSALNLDTEPKFTVKALCVCTSNLVNVCLPALHIRALTSPLPQQHKVARAPSHSAHPNRFPTLT